MAVIHFYEKPGCMTNARQKLALTAAGHLLMVHNLLEEPWGRKRAKLRAFFGAMPVPQWFNVNAPEIKTGDVLPATLSEQQAIDLMVDQPLLIRRPLLEIEGHYYAGFDPDQLNRLHNLALATDRSMPGENCAKNGPVTLSEP